MGKIFFDSTEVDFIRKFTFLNLKFRLWKLEDSEGSLIWAEELSSGIGFYVENKNLISNLGRMTQYLFFITPNILVRSETISYLNSLLVD